LSQNMMRSPGLERKVPMSTTDRVGFTKRDSRPATTGRRGRAEKMVSASGVLTLLLIVFFLLPCGSSLSRGTDVSADNLAFVGWAAAGKISGYGLILSTVDGGQTWTRQGTPRSVPDADLASAAAIDACNCWIVGTNSDGFGTILRTRDGGKTWARQGSAAEIPDAELLKISAVDKDTAWTVGYHGTILATGDGGRTWSSKKTDTIPDVQLQGVYALDAKNVWVTGCNSDGYATVFRTADGGASWVRKGSPAELPDHLLDIKALDDDTAWTIGGGTSVLHTTDNGQSWTKKTLGGGFFDANGVAGVGRDTVWVVTDSDGIYRTSNSGASWKQQTAAGGNYYLMCIDALNTQYAWASGIYVDHEGKTSGIIENTVDGGGTWKKQIELDTGIMGVSVVYAPPKVSAITPDNGRKEETVSITDLGGQAFRAGATVKLAKAGQPDINTTDITVVTRNKITCSVALPPDATTGDWDVVVENPDGQSATLAGAFRVNPTTLATWYLAEGTTAWGFSTYVTIENPTDEDLHAKITYLNTNATNGGGNVAQRTVTLPARSQTTVDPRPDLGDTDFATRVECVEGRDIAVDRTVCWTGEGASCPEAHSSIGVNAPANTWYLPEGSSKHGFECWTLIANPNRTAAKVTLVYMIEGAAPRTLEKTVPACSRATFNMEKDIGAADASIQVDSDRPVIAERSMYRNRRREGHCSVGATCPAKDFYLAEGTTAWGFTTYVLVQNPNNETADVTVWYMTPKGPVQYPEFTMPANSRKTLRANDYLPDTDISIRLHGSRPIIAERAMYWRGGPDRSEACHDSIGLATPHRAFYLPEGQASDGFETFTLVQNPGDEGVSIKVTYLSKGGGRPVSFTDVVPSNSRRTYSMVDAPKSGRASVLVQVNEASGRIIAERSMYWNSRGTGTCTIGGFSD